ncbi:MAG: Fpg/Nei family DNA glycosylase [Verrucomicrobiota bacterium]|nr:Fpg/Nei family DNA glycosylase [Verrucomicrobiota bacterium]
MPELAEVEFYRKQWNGGLKQKVVALHLHGAKRIFRGIDLSNFKKNLCGATFLKSEAHGKQMLFQFSGGNWLAIHLGMTGKLRVETNDFHPTSHDHLALLQKKRALVFSDPRQFGRVLFHHGKNPPDWWKKLPPSLVSSKFTLTALEKFLQRRRTAPIKAVLLLQNGFPGIGNWMADEILWQSQIHPRAAAGIINSAKRKMLYQKIRSVCRAALRIIGEDFSDPPRSWLFQHRWKKKGHCPKDHSVLQHATIGGRTTCWCPACQRL